MEKGWRVAHCFRKSTRTLRDLSFDTYRASLQMPTRPAFPDPPSRPGMVGLGLVIPLPRAAEHSTSGNRPLPVLPVQEQQKRDGIDIRRPEELALSLQAVVPSSPVVTPHLGHMRVLNETATTSCKIPLSPLPLPSFQSAPHVSQAAIVIASGQAPKPSPPTGRSRPKFKRSVALLSSAICSPPGRSSLGGAIPAFPFSNRSQARGLPRSKTKKIFVSSSRSVRRCSRHMQSFRGKVPSTGSRRNSGSSADSSNRLSVSTSNAYISPTGLASLPITALKHVRRPRVSPAGSTRLTPTSSIEAISLASWIELGDSMSLPGDIICSSPEPIDPSFSITVEGDWEDDISQVPLPADLTSERGRPSGARRGLFRHGAIVRFTQTLKRAKKAKASRKRGSRKGSVAEDRNSGGMRWSPQVSLFPHLAQILSTPRPAVFTFESTDPASPPVMQTDQLDPDVRNVLSGLWSRRPEDSPWVRSESTTSRTRPSNVILWDNIVVGRPVDDGRLGPIAMSDYSRAQEDEGDVLQMYEDMSSCPSDSWSSGFCSSVASSTSGSSSSSASMW